VTLCIKKESAFGNVEEHFEVQGIAIIQMNTRPAPFNNLIAWDWPISKQKMPNLMGNTLF